MDHPDIMFAINERNKLYKEFIDEKTLIQKWINTADIKQNETLLLPNSEKLKNIFIVPFLRK